MVSGPRFFLNKPILCHTVACICLASCTCSMWNIAAVAINRYVAITKENVCTQTKRHFWHEGGSARIRQLWSTWFVFLNLFFKLWWWHVICPRSILFLAFFLDWWFLFLISVFSDRRITSKQTLTSRGHNANSLLYNLTGSF